MSPAAAQLDRAAYAVQRLLTEPYPAQTSPTPAPNPNSSGAEFGKSAPIGLVVVLVIMIALVLLIRSMNRHVRGLPEEFGAPPER